MTAQEFGEWRAFFLAEQLHPSAQRVRFAQLLSATHNGAVTKRGGGMFSVDDFLPVDPWAPAAPPSEAPTAEQLAAQIAAMNRSLDS